MASKPPFLGRSFRAPIIAAEQPRVEAAEVATIQVHGDEIRLHQGVNNYLSKAGKSSGTKRRSSSRSLATGSVSPSVRNSIRVSFAPGRPCRRRMAKPPRRARTAP